MKNEDLVKLNVNNSFRKKFDQPIKTRLPQIKEQSLIRGRVIQPILVWRTEEKDEVVYGHSLVILVRENPTLECTVIYVEYKDWREAVADITEYVCALEEVFPWHKLVLCIDCEDYWYDVELAKQNRGKRTDLDKDGVSKFKTHKVNEIIAKKTGLSTTTVSNFKIVKSSGRKDLIEQCEKGELGIATAYKMLKPKKDENESDKKSGKLKDKASLKIEVIKSCNIFAECEKLPPSKKKSIGLTHKDEDYRVIIDKITNTKLPAGRIWIAVDKDDGSFYVASKTSDEATGRVKVILNSFDLTSVETVDSLSIFAADFIFWPEAYNRKDETDFDNAVKTDIQEEPQ